MREDYLRVLKSLRLLSSEGRLGVTVHHPERELLLNLQGLTGQTVVLLCTELVHAMNKYFNETGSINIGWLWLKFSWEKKNYMKE